MIKNLFLHLLLLLPSTIFAQTVERESNPRSIQIITEDINRFWTAFDSSKVNPSHSEDIFQTLYLDKGTPGLREFDIQSLKGVKNLESASNKYDLYYKSIRSNTLAVSKQKKQIVKALVKFKKLYKPAKFPPVYFLIGDLNSGGRSSEEGLLIGTEVNCANDTSDFTNIYPAFIPVLKSLTPMNIPNIVVHELMHYQQTYADQEVSLLGSIIREGSAAFLSELVTQIPSNSNLKEYGDKHERELWDELKKDLTASNLNKWLYNSAVEGRPADLGYYMGFKIAESYYHQSKNKKQAVREMLNINNFQEFLIQSKYQVNAHGE